MNLIAIVGPTGTGKTDLSLEIAERLSAGGTPVEIVNADAMQFYRGMDIGTAKLPTPERRGIPHHLIDVLDVTEEATVAWFQPKARAAIETIRTRGALPILVGGSGLYVSSVIYDFQFPATDPSIRSRLEDEAGRVGPGGMHRKLAAVDPSAARAIGSTNTRRLVRALEVVELTGKPYGAALPEAPTAWIDSLIVGLRAPRAELTALLDARVERMWHEGLVAEAAALVPKGLERGVTASRAIGYAQALAQLRGDLTQDEAIAQTQQLTRRYARRQMSWFNRYPDIQWLDYAAPDLVDQCLARL